MTRLSRDIQSAARFSALIAFTVLSLSFFLSLLFYKVGLPTKLGTYVGLSLFVSVCVAGPTVIIAFWHDHKMRTYQSRLEKMAWTDALTGLLNRRFFVHAADEERARMQRTRHEAALVLIDLDHFKEVNDLYGHSGGDIVLKEVASIAHSELRGPFDRLGRWGGEEFVVLLSAVSQEQALLVCERLRRRIETASIRIDDKDVSITASFGVCMMKPDADLTATIEAADEALYAAKRLGRNQVVCATPSEVAESVDVKSLPFRKRVESRRKAQVAALYALATQNKRSEAVTQKQVLEA